MPAVASRANIHKHSHYTSSLSGTNTMCGFVVKIKTERIYPVLFSKEHALEERNIEEGSFLKKSLQQRNVNTLQMYATDLTGTSDRKLCVQRCPGVTVSNMKHL